jgi:tetratricopeptide (TPR) repeat protein
MREGNRPGKGPGDASSNRGNQGSARYKGSNAGRKRQLVHVPDALARELRETARPGKGDMLVKVFAEAATAFSEEDYAEAVRLGEQAKHMAMRAAGPRELLGLAYYRNESYREAARELAAFRRISGSTEQNPVIADCYRALQKPNKALELIDEMDPSVDEAVRYEGAIVAAGALADGGRIDEALERLEELELRPASASEHHLRAWYVLGDLLERKGRYTQARSWFEAVASADPEFTDAAGRAHKLASR